MCYTDKVLGFLELVLDGSRHLWNWVQLGARGIRKEKDNCCYDVYLPAFPSFLHSYKQLPGKISLFHNNGNEPAQEWSSDNLRIRTQSF